MWKDRCFIWEDVQDPRRSVYWADKGWVIQPPKGRGGRHNHRDHHHRAPPGHRPPPQSWGGHGHAPQSEPPLWAVFPVNEWYPSSEMQFLSNSSPVVNHKAGSKLPWAGNPKARTVGRAPGVSYLFSGACKWGVFWLDFQNESENSNIYYHNCCSHCKTSCPYVTLNYEPLSFWPLTKKYTQNVLRKD